MPDCELDDKPRRDPEYFGPRLRAAWDCLMAELSDLGWHHRWLLRDLMLQAAVLEPQSVDRLLRFAVSEGFVVQRLVQPPLPGWPVIRELHAAWVDGQPIRVF